MTGTDMRITDPMDREVVFPGELRVESEIKEPTGVLLFDDFQKVVATPACIIELAADRVYYFRSVEWNVTVLVEAVCREGHWLAVKCLKNPSSPYITSLLRNGKFIAGATLA